jgi:plasmid stabilization system protein ParE
VSTAKRVEVAGKAQGHIATASAWWVEHRTAAPDAFFEELDRIFALLLVEPEMGTPARNAGLPGVRRVTLTRIRYHVYYRLSDNAIQVLAVWHASRGQDPKL